MTGSEQWGSTGGGRGPTVRAATDIGRVMTASPAAQAPLKDDVIDGFDRIAARYDLLTRINPGYLKHLRWSAQRLRLQPGARVLDCCCGTGLSTRAVAETYPDAAEIIGLDASGGMLAVARDRVRAPNLRFVQGNGMAPTESGVEGPFDGILMAYGIRNMPDVDTSLANVLALLAPGAPICFHEYSVKDSLAARAVWNAVANTIIIPSGVVATGSTGIWRYLRASVNDFDGVRAFEQRLRRAGFTDVRTLPMDGWQRGIVHSFLARRPL